MLSDREIREHLDRGALIENHAEECIQPASYDLRVGSRKAVAILPHEHVLVSTIERVTLPDDVAGMVWLRSTLARRGVLFGGGWVDPGFRGNLTISLYNAGRDPIELEPGQRIAQLIFLRLPPTSGYAGRYQDSEGVRGPKDKERGG